jgi:hypothetical protein
VAAVKAAVESDTVEQIQETVGNLMQAIAVTSQPAAEAEVQPGEQPAAETTDNVVDAEFTEVTKEEK